MTASDSEDFNHFPNSATPVGSKAYYAVRFAPARYRQELALILAWSTLVGDIPTHATEINIAEVKLQWWMDEMLRIFHQNPQHPIGHRLAPLVAKHNLRLECFTNILHGIRNAISGRQHESMDELVNFCERGKAELFEILTRCSGCREQTPITTARRLGVYCGLVDSITHLGGDLRQGRCYLPQELMRQAGVTCDTLAHSDNKVAAEALLHRVADYAQDWLANTDSTPEAGQPTPRTATIFAALNQTLLAEIKSDIVSVLHRKIELTPIRMFWIAWRRS